ncbi:uncharacterized protein [Macrobrachium rosenbergii]|uniref:uncharacterized protein n=1 Tax=Macrobrachium rosenbergii TaxID=79674 RepID=UPI0034D62ACA
MFDKDPEGDSSEPCGSRESEMSEEEQKPLLSSGATGKQEKHDPASCQSDLAGDPIADFTESASSLLTVLKTSVSSDIPNSNNEATENSCNENSANENVDLLEPLLTTSSQSDLPMREYQDASAPLIQKQFTESQNEEEEPVSHSVPMPSLQDDPPKSVPSEVQNKENTTDFSQCQAAPSQHSSQSVPQQDTPALPITATSPMDVVSQDHSLQTNHQQPSPHSGSEHSLSVPLQNIVLQPVTSTSPMDVVSQDQHLQGQHRQPSPHRGRENSQSLAISPHNQLMATPNQVISPPPNAFLPHPYWPVSYQYPPHLNQPYPPMQYPAPPIYPYYQPMPLLQPYHGPLTQPLSPQPSCEGHNAVPFQQNQLPPCLSNHTLGIPNQNNLGSNQQPKNPASVSQQDQRLEHGRGSSPLVTACDRTSEHNKRPQNAKVSEPEILQSLPPCPFQTVIYENHKSHSSKPVVGMRLQGPRHLFTVVPVANGELETVEEESKPTPSGGRDPSSSEAYSSSMLPVKSAQPTSLPTFAPSKSEPVSSHPLEDDTSPIVPISIEKGGTLTGTTLNALTQTKSPKNCFSATAGRGPNSKDDSYLSPKGIRMQKISSPGRNVYHTVTGMPQGQSTLCRDNTLKGLSNVPRGFTVGGLGLSPFHPRGEYGVGGAAVVRGKRDAGVLNLPRNPYHTVTGMVSNPHPVRDYGIGGGNSSPLLNHRDEIPSYRPRGPGGIPASLASVVMPKDPTLVSSRSSKSLKRLSWGYTVTEPRSILGHSSSAKHLGNTLVEENADGVAAPLILPVDQMNITELNELTVNSMGGISIEVGSTDGRAMTVRGALTSPDQLPYLPAVFRHSHLEGGKDTHDTYGGSDGRQTWGNKAQFVLACIGYAVGLGNLWRFPYLCYKSGGGAFLIPYFLMLFLCGIPLLLMELAVGQYTRRGPIGALEKLCPIFKGAGVGTVIMSFLLGTYYNVIIAWAIYYLFQSFTSELPWRFCDPAWAVNCFDHYGINISAPNGTKSATEEYFDEVVLRKSRGLEEMGSFRLEILLALFGAWVLVYFCLWKSIKSSGKVVYVTATLPYVLIGAFLWRALTLPGASTGLQYFFSPRWELLLKGEVWVAAAAQNFNSIGIAFGSLIAFSSYNKFNNNIVLDTWAISLTNSFTSLMSGMIVFSTLGNIALEQSKDMDEVVAQGPGLVFMVYPQALAKMPYGGIWAVLFFFMLLILGLDSQFANVEVIITSLQDGFPKWLKNNLKHHEILVLIVCLISFICGLPNVMQGGIYFFTLIDYYAANISLMYLAFFEVVSIVWIYGAGRLARNVQEMTSRLPSLYFRGCWYVAAPLLIMAIWIFSIVDYKRPTYNNGEYQFPDWAVGMGWVIASLSIVPIPIFAVIAVWKAEGTTFWEKFKNSFHPQIDDCDCIGGVFEEDDDYNPNKEEFLDCQVKLVVYNGPSSELKKSSDDGQEKSEKETKNNGKT